VALQAAGVTSTDSDSALVTSPGLQRVNRLIMIVLLATAGLAVAKAAPALSPLALSGAAVALVVAAGCFAVAASHRLRSARLATAALLLAGLAGAALAGLIPATLGFVVVYMSLVGIGLRLSPRPAFTTALVVFAAMNLSYYVSGPTPVTVVASQDCGAVFVFAVGAFARSARFAQQQAREAQTRAEGLLAQLRTSEATQKQAAALSERARLAREIHDVMAHALSGLVLALDTMELLARQDDTPDTLARIREQASRSQRIARAGLADTRSAIAALRGDELPGPALLDGLVRDTAAATEISAELTVTGPIRPVLPEIGLTIYRTAQEALTNSAKHAGRGARVRLRLHYDRDTVELVIEDARPQGAPAVSTGLTFGGYGLTGMRERAELLGGSLTAGPTDRGFTVHLRLPDGGPRQARSPAGGQAYSERSGFTEPGSER
jgi:signal transduction histidine kinase